MIGFVNEKHVVIFPKRLARESEDSLKFDPGDIGFHKHADFQRRTFTVDGRFTVGIVHQTDDKKLPALYNDGAF